MPIYEYLCNSCGVEKEHLQKISDAPRRWPCVLFVAAAITLSAFLRRDFN